MAQDIIPLHPTSLLMPLLPKHLQAIIGENDAVIPPKLHIVPQGDHYSIYEDGHSWQAVSSFIEKIIELDGSGIP